jgi:hypothetical protein
VYDDANVLIFNVCMTETNSGQQKTNVQILCAVDVKFNTILLHKTFICWLMLTHVSAFNVDHLQGAFCNLCDLYWNLHIRVSNMSEHLLTNKSVEQFNVNIYEHSCTENVRTTSDLCVVHV